MFTTTKLNKVLKVYAHFLKCTRWYDKLWCISHRIKSCISPLHLFIKSNQRQSKPTVVKRLADQASDLLVEHPLTNQKPSVINSMLTHWRRVTHICVGNLTIIGPDDGLSPGRRQAIIWTNAGIVNWNLRNKLQWNFNRNSNIVIQEMRLKVSSAKRRPFCLGNVLNSMDFDKDFRSTIQAHGWFTGTGTDSRKIGPSRLTATKHNIL